MILLACTISCCGKLWTWANKTSGWFSMCWPTICFSSPTLDHHNYRISISRASEQVGSTTSAYNNVLTPFSMFFCDSKLIILGHGGNCQILDLPTFCTLWWIVDSVPNSGTNPSGLMRLSMQPCPWASSMLQGPLSKTSSWMFWTFTYGDAVLERILQTPKSP